MESSKFSDRTSWEQTSNPLHQKQIEIRNAGAQLLDLTVSNPTQCGFHYLDQILLKDLNHLENLTYLPDPHGLLTCRKVIAAYYARKEILVDPEQVFITASTSEAYSLIFKLLLNSGDEILAPQPSYPLLDYLAQINDVKVNRYFLSALNENIDLKKTKALLLVHPNNPTGNYVSQEERLKINDLAKNHSWSLIVDEVFLDYPLQNSVLKNSSFAGNQNVLTFTLSGISKVLGLPQMKLSWLVVSGPEELRKEAITRLEILADTFLSASTPIQNAFPEWMKQIDKIQTEILNQLQANYSWLVKESKSHQKIKVSDLQGGWCVPIELPASLSDESWALRFLEEAKTIVHPGYFYDFLEGSRIVVSLLTPEKDFREGFDRILKLCGAS